MDTPAGLCERHALRPQASVVLATALFLQRLLPTLFRRVLRWQVRWTLPLSGPDPYQRLRAGVEAYTGRGAPTAGQPAQPGATAPPPVGAGQISLTGTGRRAPAIEPGLEYAALRAGVNIEVGHGIEPGHARHTHGAPAYDLDLRDPRTGKLLDSRNLEERKRIAQFIEDNVAAGNMGVGAGKGEEYMGPFRFHVGGGKPAYWGAKGAGANAPGWLKEAWERGMNRKMSAQQVAQEVTRLRQQQTTQTAQQPTDGMRAVRTVRVGPGGEQLAGPSPTGGQPSIGARILQSGAFFDRQKGDVDQHGKHDDDEAKSNRMVTGRQWMMHRDQHGKHDEDEAKSNRMVTGRQWLIHRGQAQPTIDPSRIDRTLAGQTNAARQLGSAHILIEGRGLPRGMRVRAQRGDGIFEKMNIKQTPQMARTGSHGVDAQEYAEE